MPGLDHIHIGIDEDGEPIAAFDSIEDARSAVQDRESLKNEDIVDYIPDVPHREDSDS